MNENQLSPEQEQEAINEVNKINNIAKALRVANIGLSPQTIQAILNPALTQLVRALAEAFEGKDTLSLTEIDEIVSAVAEATNPAKKGKASKLDK